tara:strand:- start:133 stop:657 length:525 start_codon:yes stop_codon:yes gene_type:complete
MNKYFLLLVFFNCVVLKAQLIDSTESKVEFKVKKHKRKTVSGTFTGMSGEINFMATDLTNSSFDVCIDASTVKTDNNLRDRHLRNKKEYLNVEKFPTICFKSFSISKTKDGYETTGNLTLHGVTLEITIPFTYVNNTFVSNFELLRYAFGIGKEGGNMISKEVDVTITCVEKIK